MSARYVPRWVVLGLGMAIGACAGSADQAPVVEHVVRTHVEFAVQAQGSLRASKSTPLKVPGRQWAQRQLVWMAPEGSRVKQGEVLARFSAEQSKLQLATAQVDLQRNALARTGKQDELDQALAKLGVDLAQVLGDLGIAQRYAHATEAALARNAILDAVQDEHYLGEKQSMLMWDKDLSATRGKAELGLIDAQRATSQTVANERRDDLDALDLRAPHDGLLIYEADPWSGEKPRIGASKWAGNNFASLPDTRAMEVEISLPQIEAQALKPGLRVELAPLGAPEQKIQSTISWVAAAAAQRSRESPVKYLSAKAGVPPEAIDRYRWSPGQQFAVRILLLQSDDAMTVPNIAIDNRSEANSVRVLDAGAVVVRPVRVGVRGPSRSEILEGLAAGEAVVLDSPASPPAAVKAPAAGAQGKSVAAPSASAP